MSIIIRKKVSTINNKTLGKTYGRVVHTETLTLRKFAQHIADHGSTYGKSEIYGMLMQICECLVEVCMDSKKVQLGDLGTFYMTARSTGEENAANFSMNNIKGLRLRFTPNQKRDFPLDSISNRQNATLRDLDTILGNNTADDDSGSGDEPVIVNP
ncbi:MAG: hypothetical protein K6G08_07285 [Prevotella sp.]|nr:hypothetical protein [Prevotella sp.]